ncbi:MAG: putative periplasmic protein SanA, affects membrane permeability for vancomycin [Chloroflexi bacterium AL-W]|nr:putative periplasmic protein SanA, affects membrane permeability for vancomycin [Chloroflexi bacterium AL-N1]NOK71346.1 putative periplasmic protein SanA, affects membrane permeability for vancomycin [Chloroflexi bacterium AL-N10]NOK78749.1 putative periplasmic protein SanA, affects membrane permeability for vancomycin [Chloroflexi bacterium AL-N5]NOK86119.1 putative periplasmic protein SanA, affects membrane permeability for vancomycin [Chloroflexi bacterium AL-W]NOK93072.1 putative peripla
MIFVCAVVFAPLLLIRAMYATQIHFQTTTLSPAEYGIVPGARVFPDGSLSAVVQERADAAILLYQHELIDNVFVSGDNRHNAEADAITAYLIRQGIPQENITTDRTGIDTGDTCRHFARTSSTGIVITQEFHLPRAMFLCDQYEANIAGLAVNHLGLLESRGSNPLAVYRTRLWRSVREAVLIWSILLGVYDVFSNEAERMEQQ